MYYAMFSTIVNVTNGCLGGGWSVCFGNEKGLNVGFNIILPPGKVLPSTTAHNHGISNMMTSLTLMLSYSHCPSRYVTSKGPCSIHISWATPLCLGLVQFLQLAAKEHKNGKRNDLDDDKAGTTATTDVTIAVDNNTAAASKEGDEGNHLWQ
jgi:hypothetical protein